MPRRTREQQEQMALHDTDDIIIFLISKRIIYRPVNNAGRVWLMQAYKHLPSAFISDSAVQSLIQSDVAMLERRGQCDYLVVNPTWLAAANRK